ncbi:MAG: BolA/IbaG family iron-sulfur metabolism protein [Thermoanaerobaculia bacterium]|nr:BolA/IbaG family iron-sulfur metabolism protein [Thermoanaerobaculia bacterium]
MGVRDTIEAKLADALAPSHLEVLDESHMHNVPAGSQSHFRIRVVSDAFAQRRLVERHRVINELLAAELAGPVHALALETLTADEWRRRREVGRESPECLGGGRG